MAKQRYPDAVITIQQNMCITLSSFEWGQHKQTNSARLFDFIFLLNDPAGTKFQQSGRIESLKNFTTQMDLMKMNNSKGEAVTYGWMNLLYLLETSVRCQVNIEIHSVKMTKFVFDYP